MTDHILSVKASGEVRDANGNIKKDEYLTGLFSDDELTRIMHSLQNAKDER